MIPTDKVLEFMKLQVDKYVMENNMLPILSGSCLTFPEDCVYHWIGLSKVQRDEIKEYLKFWTAKLMHTDETEDELDILSY